MKHCFELLEACGPGEQRLKPFWAAGEAPHPPGQLYPLFLSVPAVEHFFPSFFCWSLLFNNFPSLQTPFVLLPFTWPQTGFFSRQRLIHSWVFAAEELLILAFWLWPGSLSALWAALWAAHLGSAAGERRGWSFFTEQRTLEAPWDPLSLSAHTAPLPESGIHRRP